MLNAKKMELEKAIKLTSTSNLWVIWDTCTSTDLCDHARHQIGRIYITQVFMDKRGPPRRKQQLTSKHIHGVDGHYSLQDFQVSNKRLQTQTTAHEQAALPSNIKERVARHCCHDKYTSQAFETYRSQSAECAQHSGP